MIGAGEQQQGTALAGEWIGFYTGHYDETIRIVANGGAYEAWKITGDDYVPAGELTWCVNVRTLSVPGRLEIIDADHIRFHWQEHTRVEYRRDD
jgi:hypothetical protein